MNDPSHTLSPDWLNENALRAYPLTDDAPAAEIIPSWLIADLHLTVDASYTSVYVSSVYLSSTLLSVGISGIIGDGNPIGLLTRTVTRDELEPYHVYSLDRLSDTASGTIAFGEPPTGTYTELKATFSPHESAIVASALVRTTPPGVTRIRDVAHGTEVTGIVDLSGNSEFRTSLDPSDTTGKTILITLTDLYRDLTTSVCNATPSFSACGQTPVTSINGVTPTSTGVLYLRFR